MPSLFPVSLFLVHKARLFLSTRNSSDKVHTKWQQQQKKGDFIEIKAEGKMGERSKMKGREKESEPSPPFPKRRTFARLNSLLLLRQKEKMQFGNVVVWRSLYRQSSGDDQRCESHLVYSTKQTSETSPHIYMKRGQVKSELRRKEIQWWKKGGKKINFSPNVGMHRIDRSMTRKVHTCSGVPLDF